MTKNIFRGKCLSISKTVIAKAFELPASFDGGADPSKKASAKKENAKFHSASAKAIWIKAAFSISA
jgi:hypothetical protein